LARRNKTELIHSVRGCTVGTVGARIHMKTLIKAVILSCLCAMVGACGGSREPFKPKAAEVVPGAEKKNVAAPDHFHPEHFDRVRDEQLEKEEERLRQRGRNN